MRLPAASPSAARCKLGEEFLVPWLFQRCQILRQWPSDLIFFLAATVAGVGRMGTVTHSLPVPPGLWLSALHGWGKDAGSWYTGLPISPSCTFEVAAAFISAIFP